jgi:protein CpxP
MKKLLMVCCFVASMVSLSKAQGGGQRMTPAEQAKQLQTELKLTDDQTSKITGIMQMQATKMDSVRTASNGDRQAMMQGMMPIRTAMSAKIKAVLTADQAKAYDKMMAERMDRMRQRMGGGGGGTPPPPQK